MLKITQMQQLSDPKIRWIRTMSILILSTYSIHRIYSWKWWKESDELCELISIMFGEGA